MTKREKIYHRTKKRLKEYNEFSLHWLCYCGHYEESGMHCSNCGNEPPWGCDCSFCNEYPEDDFYGEYNFQP